MALGWHKMYFGEQEEGVRYVLEKSTNLRKGVEKKRK